MKKLVSLALLCAALAVPIQSDGWVAAGGRGGAVAAGGACWHSGWSCGGVCTGTAVAAGATGLAAGAAVGSAVARANQPAYVAGARPPVVAAAVPSVRIGTVYPTLPYGAQPLTIAGQQYYNLAGTYYQPYFGGNGVYYQVVPAPQ